MADLTATVKDEQARARAIRRWSVLALLAAASVGGFFALKGCDDEVRRDVQSVKIGGEWFHLEIADSEAVRMKGLGQRTYIAKDGGMLFVFSAPQSKSGGGFVMRDCPIPIDIIYVDGSGRVGNWHAMQPLPPRGEGEGAPGDQGNEKYEERLKKNTYLPRYDYQFAIELAGGTLDGALKGKIKEGEKIDLPLDALKKRAK